jgi:hypothetical protein
MVCDSIRVTQLYIISQYIFSQNEHYVIIPSVTGSCKVGRELQKNHKVGVARRSRHRIFLRARRGYEEMTAQQPYDDVLSYVGSDNFINWYVGITGDVEKRLFGEHNVHRTQHKWIHGQAMSAETARAVEAALIELGFDGGGGGGDHTAIHVYAFRQDLGTVR